MQFCPEPLQTKILLMRRPPAERVVTARHFGHWPVRIWQDLRYTVDVFDGTIVVACQSDMSQPKDVIVVTGLGDEGPEPVAYSLATVRQIEHLHAGSPERIPITFTPNYIHEGSNGGFTWRDRKYTIRHQGYRRHDGYEVLDENQSVITTYKTLADLRLSFGRN